MSPMKTKTLTNPFRSDVHHDDNDGSKCSTICSSSSSSSPSSSSRRGGWAVIVAIDLIAVLVMFAVLSQARNNRSATPSSSIDDIASQLTQLSQQVDFTEHLKHKIAVEESQLVQEEARIHELEEETSRLQKNLEEMARADQTVIQADGQKIDQLSRELNVIKSSFGAARREEGQRIQQLSDQNQNAQARLTRERAENEQLRKMIEELQSGSSDPSSNAKEKLRGAAPKRNAQRAYRAGEPVEVLHADDGSWYPGLVARVISETQRDGIVADTYDVVHIDDGRLSRSVVVDNMQHYQPYGEGDEVHCKALQGVSAKAELCKVVHFHPWPAMEANGVHGVYEVTLEGKDDIVPVPARFMYRTSVDVLQGSQ